MKNLISSQSIKIEDGKVVTYPNVDVSAGCGKPRGFLYPALYRLKGKVAPNVLYPEIHSDYRTNFKIDRDDIGSGTPLERFYHHKSAIQL